MLAEHRNEKEATSAARKQEEEAQDAYKAQMAANQANAKAEQERVKFEMEKA